MKLIAFDPGDTTGYVVINTETKKLLNSGIVKYNEKIMTVREVIIHCVMLDPSPTTIVYESFLIRSGHAGGAQKDVKAAQIIGRIKTFADEFNCDISGQPPAVRIRIDNDVLRDAGYNLKEIKSPHTRDALRHAVRAMRKNDEKWHEELKLKEARRKGLIK